MSEKPSETQQRRSSGAAIESTRTDADIAADTLHYLTVRGLVGIVFVDDDLVAIRAIGESVRSVIVGRPVGECILPLLGLDEQIRALKSGSPAMIEMANISMQTTESEQPRVNLAVYWRADRACYTVILSRIAAEPTFEIELQAQINARLLAEEQVRQKSAELEAFAYVISHDLRTPLRALRQLSDEVRLSLAEDPPDITRADASATDLIVQSRRMSAMLLGLLEYAQIGRRPEALEMVDSAVLMHEIRTGLGRAKSMPLTIEETWPVFETFKAPLDLVLRNLVDNAVKHHDRENGAITACVADGGRHWIFSISDDGAGIAPEWHKAIFEPFRKVDQEAPGRLAPEGSGIGLALVKKTVETMGGRIDVRSNPMVSRGTTFRVFWPKRPRSLVL